MENMEIKRRVNHLVYDLCDLIDTLRLRSVRNTPVKLARNSMVEKFVGANRDYFVLTYKEYPIAVYDSEGCIYDITDLWYFHTKKIDRIIRKFQKEYALNFSVYYVYTP